MSEEVLERYDEWLTEKSTVAALIMRQWLVPVEGKEAVIFPPTYPISGKEAGYNIDVFPDGSSVCQLDSVGSQANRMEPIFEREPYSKLVPQVVIKAGGREVNLLEAGHRAADAIVRFSNLGEKLAEAFREWQRYGNAEPLARIAPTSIVFGSWDSRSTQAKLPRVVRSVVRGFNVRELHRSAQYTTIAGEVLEGADVQVATTGPRAELGLAHVPATWTPGGVQVLGEIRRDATLNLVAIRALGAAPGNGDESVRLRRYILGLALVAFTAPQEVFLREGCLLVPDVNRPAEWEIVYQEGKREPKEIRQQQALDYATAGATAFGVQQQSEPVTFDAQAAKVALGLTKEERKAAARQRRQAATEVSGS